MLFTISPILLMILPMTLAQVKVVMRKNDDRTQICNNLASNHCCTGTPGTGTIPGTGTYFKFVDFSGIYSGPAVASVWQQSGVLKGCAGRVKDVSIDPNWHYVDEATRITGAKWTALTDIAAAKMRRGARTEEAEADVDVVEVYPDVITIRGVEYSDEKRGDLVYRDAEGNVLDLAELEE